MARIRSIHPGLFTDEAFVGLTVDAPLGVAMLLGLWCEADDQGVFEWKPIRYKMRILPAVNIDAGALLDVLEASGFIRRFEVNGKPYGACKNFCKWQRPKTLQILYPCPPDIALLVGVEATEERDKPDRGTALGKMLHERQDGCCYYCSGDVTFYRKRPNSLEIDHKTPVSRGGADSIENLAAACRRCNSLKSSMTESEFRGKFSADELRQIHSGAPSHGAKEFSQSPKEFSRSANSPKAEIHPQMEDGGGREEESKKDSVLRTAASAALPARDELWSNGLKSLRDMTGKPEGPTRALLGKLCKEAGDDCAVVSQAIAEAVDLRPGDPVAWLMKAVKARQQPRNGFIALIHNQGIGAPTIDAHTETNPVLALLAKSGGFR